MAHENLHEALAGGAAGNHGALPWSTVAGRRTPLAPADVFQLILVMFLWALCYPLIATGLAAAPPLTFAALRSFVAGIGLLLPAFVVGRAIPRGWATWLCLLGVGVSATSLGFAGMFLAGERVSPGLATVLANVQPLIAAALAYVFLHERLGSRRRLGLFFGLVGIVLVALPAFGAGGSSSPAGVGFVLMGAVGVAVGNVLLKRLAGQVDLLMAMGWQFVLGGVFLWIAAGLFETPVQIVWSPTFVTVLLALGLLGTALAFALWFSLLHREELTRLNTFTFLTPVFGLLIAFMGFDERIGVVELGGIFFVIAGVWWISFKPAPIPPRQPRK